MSGNGIFVHPDTGDAYFQTAQEPVHSRLGCSGCAFYSAKQANTYFIPCSKPSAFKCIENMIFKRKER